MNRMGVWGGRGGQREVYRYTAENKHRMGNCAWLPKEGDICIRVADAGDCFHDYVALRKRKDGTYRKVGKFGAYIFGKCLGTLNERTFHLACAGEAITIPKNIKI